MLTIVGVDCVFNQDGTVTVRRIKVEGDWLPVEQGRQWVNGEGRHVLIKFSEGPVREICLRSDTLTWELRPAQGQRKTWV
jgi:hypothetical protein